MSDDTMIALLGIALGHANGLWLGWVLWRRPKLKYKEQA